MDVKAVHKEGGDSLVRAATTASLDAQQDSSNIAKTQSKATLNEPNPQGEGLGNTVRSREDRMEHAIKLTDPVPQTPHDLPLSGGHKPESDECSMTLKELTDLYTTLSQKVLDLEKVKTAQAKEVSSLKKRVTKLEQRQSSRISGFHPFRASTSRRHSLGRRNVSKQRRKNLKSQQKFQDIDDLVDEEVIGEDKGSGEKRGSTTKKVSTARPDISAARPKVNIVEPKTPHTTTTLFDDEDVTITDILVKMKSQKAKEKGVAFKDANDSASPIKSITTLQPLPTIDLKDKGKGILQEPKPVKKTKKRDQDQIERDVEVALKIQAYLDEEVRTERERQEFASKAALAGLYDEVQAQIDADHELAARLTHEEQEKYTVKERSKLLAEFFERRKKHLAKEREQALRSKPPTKISSKEDEKRVGSRKKRAAELRKCLKVFLDDEKGINYETLDVKSHVDCESHVLGIMEACDVRVYKLTRPDGSYRHFLTFSRMLEVLDRQDVLNLHKTVMKRFPGNDPEGYDLILWRDLKTLMKSSEDDEIWRN
nr:hypothetical protein [Tanacetum cinerariifolium]